MAKFRSLREHLAGSDLAPFLDFHEPETPDLALIEAVHDPAYVADFLAGRLDAKAMRRIGLPWSEALARRARIAVGGTLLTARLALEHGMSCNTAGGTHHAFPDYGSGFCIFNDLAVAARALLDEEHVGRVLIVDLDVHQGDGTARIFREEPRVFTFSMHCAQNFPMQKETSDLDVALPAGTGDADYLTALAGHLPDLLDRLAPDLVLYDAGVDPHEHDKLGKLALTDAGLYERDGSVLSACRQRGLPVASVIGGGYADDIDALVARHAILHAAAVAVWRGGLESPREQERTHAT